MAEQKTKPSPKEIIQEALNRGKITSEEAIGYAERNGVDVNQLKLVNKEEDEFSPLEIIQEGLKRGKITPEQAQQMAKKNNIELPEEEGFWAGMGRNTARTAKDVAMAVPELADFVASPVRAAMNIIPQAMGKGNVFNPITPSVENTIDTATKGYLKPRNDIEEASSVLNRNLTGLMAGNPIQAGIKGLTLGTKAFSPKIQSLVNATHSYFGGAETGKALSQTAIPIAMGTLAGEAAQKQNPESTFEPMISNVLSGAATSLGLAGTKSGAKNISKSWKNYKNPEEALENYPKLTQAHLANPEAQEGMRLIQESEALAKKDPKYAKALHEIQTQRQNEIKGRFANQENETGETIVDKIKNRFSFLKKERADDYESKASKILERGKEVDRKDVYNTLSLIDKMKTKKLKGTKIYNALDRAEELIMKSKGNLNLLNEAKKEIQEMVNFGVEGQMILPTSVKNGLSKVANSIKTDIEKIAPEMKPINELYKKQTEHLQSLQDGIVGKIHKKGQLEPTSIPEEIFMNSDRKKTREIRDVLGNDLYKEAGQEFLNNKVNGILESSGSKHQNQISKYHDVEKFLNNNRKHFKEVLPEDLYHNIKTSADEIKQLRKGIPTEDYLYPMKEKKTFAQMAFEKAPYAVAAGGIGYGYPLKSLAGLGIYEGGKKAWDVAQNRLMRNELLNGQTPGQQIGEMARNITQPVKETTPGLLRSYQQSQQRKPLKVEITPGPAEQYDTQGRYIGHN